MESIQVDQMEIEYGDEYMICQRDFNRNDIEKVLELAKKNKFYYEEIKTAINIFNQSFGVLIYNIDKTQLHAFTILTFSSSDKTKSDRVISIQFLLVDEYHRSKHLATILIIHAKAILLLNGYPPKLICETKNSDAFKFFIKQGFNLYNKTKHHLKLKNY